MENLGKEGKDKITGFEGIIISKVNYLYGCAQYGISPKVVEAGKKPDIEYFDLGRIEIIGDGVKASDVSTDEPGCECNEHP